MAKWISHFNYWDLEIPLNEKIGPFPPRTCQFINYRILFRILCLRSLRPRLHEYVFIENDIVFNENATILLHPHIVFISFLYCSFWRPFSKVIVFSRCKVKTQSKVCGFDGNDMKTYSCRRGLNLTYIKIFSKWLMFCYILSNMSAFCRGGRSLLFWVIPGTCSQNGWVFEAQTPAGGS